MKSGRRRILSGIFAIVLTIALATPAFAAEIKLDDIAQYGGGTITFAADVLNKQSGYTNVMNYGDVDTYQCTAPITITYEREHQYSSFFVCTLRDGGGSAMPYVPDKNISNGSTCTVTEPGMYLVVADMWDFPVKLPVVLIVKEGTAPIAPTVKSFSDVAADHWAHSEIMICVQKGAITGTRMPDAEGVGSFNPDGNVTLGEFLAVLTRLICPDEIQKVEGHWALANYSAAVKAGIITLGDFDCSDSALNTPLTREDMAYILASAAEVNGETLQILPRVETLMKDYDTISPDRKEAVKQAYSNGLIAGYTDGRFGPEDTMTRAQMATVVCRLMEYAPRGEVKVPDNTKPEVVVSQNKADYVNVDGNYKGYLKPAFSREKELEALKQIKLGEDSKGVYMTVTAPSLPDVIKNEFTYTFVCTVYNSKGDYFAEQARVVGLKAGETKTAYLVSFQDTGVKSSEISEIRLSVMINNATGYQHMFTRSISNTDKSTAYAKYDDGYSDNVKFDSTSIWKGIGK